MSRFCRLVFLGCCFLAIGAFLTPPLLAQDEEDLDQETIDSDRSSRREREGYAPAPSSAPASSTGEGEEGEEWQTMTSEGPGAKGARAAAAGRRTGGGSVRISLDDKRVHAPKLSFESNSDQPTGASKRILKQVSEKIKYSDLVIRIEGHSDSVGSDQQNMDLSQKRADAVRKFLIEDGVAQGRLKAVGMGDKHPLTSNITPAGQEKNRRVEFHIE